MPNPTPPPETVVVPRERLQAFADLADSVVTTQKPDRIYWEGEWHEGGAASAFIALVRIVSAAATEMLAAPTPPVPEPAPVDALVTQEGSGRADYIRYADDMLARLFHPNGATRDDAKPYGIARNLAYAVKTLAVSLDTTAERRGYQAATERAAGIAEAEADRIKALFGDDLGPTDMRLACELKLRQCANIIRGTDHVE